jgi:hypothetical protein
VKSGHQDRDVPVALALSPARTADADTYSHTAAVEIILAGKAMKGKIFTILGEP